MCRPPILTSRNIGLAENALRALLTRALHDTGLDYQRWVVLKLVADSASPIPLATLVGQLKDFLKLDDATAIAAVNDVRARGIVEAGDSLSLTLRGRALYERLCDETGEISRQIYSGLDPDDLAATHRVLSAVTARANRLLSELRA
jgi:DNA-binding MarR family transcriptional regulator